MCVCVSDFPTFYLKSAKYLPLTTTKNGRIFFAWITNVQFQTFQYSNNKIQKSFFFLLKKKRQKMFVCRIVLFNLSKQVCSPAMSSAHNRCVVDDCGKINQIKKRQGVPRIPANAGLVAIKSRVGRNSWRTRSFLFDLFCTPM